METAGHRAALLREGELLAESAERVGLDAAVPTCPGWQVRDLLAHVGGVHRWAAMVVSDHRTEPPPAAEEAAAFVAPGDRELLDWYRAGHSALLRTLESADPDLACWHFLPAPSALAFWARRQAHETAIHRADVEAAGLQRTAPCDPAFAADGIDELLAGFLARPGGRLVADPPVSLAVRAVDADLERTVVIRPDGRQILPGFGPADASVTGPADRLYLLLWNRLPADHDATEGLRVRGERDVLTLWRNNATVRWA